MNKPESSLITLGTALHADFATWLHSITAWLPATEPSMIMFDDWQAELALAEQLQQISAWSDGLTSGLLPQLLAPMPTKQTNEPEFEPTNLAAWQPALSDHIMLAAPQFDLFQPPAAAMSSRTQASKTVVRSELRSVRQVLAAAPLPISEPLPPTFVASEQPSNQVDLDLHKSIAERNTGEYQPSQPLAQAAIQPIGSSLEPSRNQALPSQVSPIKGLADFAQLWQGAVQPEPSLLAEVAQQQTQPNQPFEQAQPTLPNLPAGSAASAWQQVVVQHDTQSFNTNMSAEQTEINARNFNSTEASNAQVVWVTPQAGNQASGSATNSNLPAPIINQIAQALELPTSQAEPRTSTSLPNLAQSTIAPTPAQVEFIQQSTASQNPSASASAIQSEQLVSEVLAALTQALQREYLRFYSDGA